LISTNTMKLSDVASMVGFSDSLYFSRVFKKVSATLSTPLTPHS
jgi:AraC family transcriptional regulator of arabinose operon